MINVQPHTILSNKKTTHHANNLRKMGVDVENCDYVVALAGNPNTGKSTVFNALTGLHQHTGNWPGKTVTRAVGGFEYAETRYKIVDLPGTYSLLAISEDEEIARDFILFGRPDVTVIVVDATCLERNLNLVLQVLEIINSIVIDLNLMDEVHRHHLQIDHQRLSRTLGVPVVPTVARYNKGIKELLKAIHNVATGQIVCTPYRIHTESPELKNAIEKLAKKIEANFFNLPNARWVAMRLLDSDQRIVDALRSGELGEINQANFKEHS